MGEPAPGAPPLLLPRGLVPGAEARRLVEAGSALALAGTGVAFTAADAVSRGDGRTLRERIPAGRLRAWAAARGAAGALDALVRPRPPFAGVSLDAPRIMGVLNVTPDSFYDGGADPTPGASVRRGLGLRDAGADLVDVGGESTRPGASPVAPEEEIRRIAPVVSGLAREDVRVSVDTRNPGTMRRARDEGAAAINDVSALTHGPDSARTAAATGLPVALMHMRGRPRTMQDAPRYRHAPLEILAFLKAAVARAEAAGIPRGRILVDPGIGFGKRDPHNLAALAWLPAFLATGCGLLVGVSRKATVGRIARAPDPADRLAGSLAAALFAAARGAHMLRVHDVAETRQALDAWEALAGA